MDEQTKHWYEELEKFKPGALAEALEAEKKGLVLPFYEITYLMTGLPLGRGVPGPSLKMNIQVPHMQLAGTEERLHDIAYQAAKEAFGEKLLTHPQTGRGAVVYGRVYDPYAWGQYLN